MVRWGGEEERNCLLTGDLDLVFSAIDEVQTLVSID